jgi:energy-coupling factor transporter ATP-binding protein EcfA2
MLDAWKSFGPLDEDEADGIRFGRLTVFVGPPDSGKSNAVDALRFLHHAAMGRTLLDALDGGPEGATDTWLGVDGGAEEATFHGAETFGLSTTWHLGEDWLIHDLVATVDDEDVAALLVSEFLVGTRSKRARATFYDTHDDSLKRYADTDPEDVVRVSFRTTKLGERASATYQDDKLVLAQLEPLKRMLPAVSASTARVRDALRSMVFVDLDAELVLSGILTRIPESARGPLAHWITLFSAGELTAVAFNDAGQLAVVDKHDALLTVENISLETLRFLGVVVALYGAPAGALVVIEEPDAGLASSQLTVLVALLETVVERQGLQIVATTHSAELVSQLSDEDLPNVVAFDRDDEGVSACASLRELKEDGLFEGPEDLERLMTDGWLEKAADASEPTEPA